MAWKLGSQTTVMLNQACIDLYIHMHTYHTCMHMYKHGDREIAAWIPDECNVTSCMYTHMHGYHTCMHIYMHAYIHACKRCIYACIYTCMHREKNSMAAWISNKCNAQSCMYTHMHGYHKASFPMMLYIHTYIHTYMHTYIHTYIHTHTDEIRVNSSQ